MLLFNKNFLCIFPIFSGHLIFSDTYFSELADALWNLAKMNFPTELSGELLVDVETCVEPIQAAAAKALAALLEMDRNQVKQTLDALMKLYHEKLKVILTNLLSFYIHIIVILSDDSSIIG